VGDSLDAGWREIAGSKAALAEALKRIALPARAVLVQAGIIVGEGVLQFTLIAFIGFSSTATARRWRAPCATASSASPAMSPAACWRSSAAR